MSKTKEKTSVQQSTVKSNDSHTKGIVEEIGEIKRQ